ncbi:MULTISPECIES: hypothetical protein [Cupriavidus]|uniref:Uncharacterized protein n=3 Tax=Cupriavidus TaxID=106589 RepID=A0A375CPI9_9BURK|nr:MULTISPECIES: hypothetical protein [Cupriavidus]MCO4865875.1 hypothetical protein [Cupriavidus sp. WGlv3]MCO4893368.1 hypothetical protein [Cupriavidus sp. WGtm5]ULX56062.1 hypothetical protein A9P79_29300 [Cupriavidus taiwanensis]CAP63838.1 hypothetical protein pRALTA_0152 [Cupriavidus taiwanensis LMG 19424]SOY74012.1 hypothetical protein CBM2592_P110011 [Cupriavidus taiwanensis]
MFIHSRVTGTAVLAVVAMLSLALYFRVTTPDAALLHWQLLCCFGADAAMAALCIVLRVRALRNTRKLMKLVRPGWL